MLLQDGQVQVARKMFDEMPERDIVSWNTMISAYCRRRDFEMSTSLFQSMPQKSTVSWNSMISLSFQSGDVEQAFHYFRAMPRRNVASWNVMISGLIKYDRVEEAQKMFTEMPTRNVISYTAIIDGLTKIGKIRHARRLFDEMPIRNSISWTVMINGYAQNGLLDEARILFAQMPAESVVAITAIVSGYCNEGRVEDARELFDAMHVKDIVSWNAMMSGYVHNDRGEEALKLFVQMMRLGTKQDHSTLLNLLVACSVLSSIKSGRQVHAITVKTGFDFDLSVCNTCITMYSKCGSVVDSEMAFEGMKSPNLVSMNNIIAAFGQHGLYDKACAMFQKLIVNGLTPDHVTFLSILSACGHSGKVNESIRWFEMMMVDYQILPRREHFSCLVDILSRAGQLNQACEVIKRMPLEADGSVWSALLGASRAYSNIEIAELAAKKLVELRPQDSGAYIMLSNIYAAAGNWREVMKVRSLMKNQGAQKQPGYSWIEIGDSVHAFLGNDSSHIDSKRVRSYLDVLQQHMTTENLGFADFIRCS